MKKGAAKGKGAKGMNKMETLPSKHAIRVAPIIADELKLKVSKAVAAKERKAAGGGGKRVKKEVKEEHDEFDEMSSDKALNTSLTKKLVGTPKKRAPAAPKGSAKKGESRRSAKENNKLWRQ